MILQIIFPTTIDEVVHLSSKPEVEGATLLAQLMHVAWLLEVAELLAGLLELVGLTAPLKVAGLAGLAWSQVAAGFSFHFLFFLKEEAFPEQIVFLLSLYFLHVFPAA